jgi:cytochrome c peroxidase
VFPGSCAIAWPAETDALCLLPEGSLPLTPQQRSASNRAYDDIASAISAYERSAEVNPFSSKFDRYLAGEANLSADEEAGLALFAGKGLCAQCHPLDLGPNGEPPLLTDFTFDNLGVPRNAANPWYEATRNPDGRDWVDEGLGGFLATRAEWREHAPANIGKHKVPTLRNVARRPDPAFVKAYMHNGYFKTLEGLVHFYNTRDVKPVCAEALTEREALARDCWPAPEVSVNVNTDELGNLGLTADEERAIVVFMETLSDGYDPP